MTTPPLLVVQTWYVVAADTGAHYEIELAPPPRPRVRLITRDHALYQSCLDLEGRDRYVVASYHSIGDRCVLDAIAPAPGVRP